MRRLLLVTLVVGAAGLVAPAAASATLINVFSNNNGTTAVTEPMTFAATAQGNPTDTTIWLRNTTTTTSVITGITVSGGGFSRPSGSAGGTCPNPPSNSNLTTSTAGSTTSSSTANCTIIIRFAPAAVGANTGNLSVTSSTAGSGSPVTRTLTGTGLADAPSAEIRNTAGTVAEPTHAFPDTVVTSTSPYTFTVVNTGNVPITNPSASSITGGDSTEFVRTSTTCGATLAVGASCNVVVNFTPTSAGPKASSLQVATGNAGTLTSALSGTAIAANPVATIQNTAGTAAEPSHDYGDVVATGTSAYTFTLRNTGNATLNGVTSQALTGTNASEFSRSTTCSATLAAGATCNITVTFAPTTTGPKTARLEVNPSNGAQATSDLTGNALAANPSFAIQNTAGTAAEPTHDWGSVNVGSSLAYVFTIRNTGNVALSSMTTQTVTGTNSAEFTRATTCAATLAVGATCTITITFTPTALGQRTATLNVTPSNGPAQSANLVGTGGGMVLQNDVTFNNGVNQKRWLDSVGVGGRAPVGDRLRFSFDVDVAAGHEIQDVLISNSSTTNDTAPADGSFSPIPNGVGRVAVSTPPGGSNRNYVEAEMQLSSISGWDTGIGDGLLCLFATPRTENRRVWLRFRDESGNLSPKYGTIVRVTDATFACSPGPLLKNQEITDVGGVAQPDGTQNAVVTPGTPVTFQFQGAASSTTGFTGINWRIRNSVTGAMFQKTPAGWSSCTAPCNTDASFTIANGSRVDYAGGATDTDRTLTVAPPSRGRWIVEATPRGSNQSLTYFQYIGSVNVNSAAAASPTVSLSGTPPARPATNSSYNITASVADPSDPAGTFDSQGGRGTIIEWDLDNNATNGPGGDGFEDRVIGDPNTGLNAAALTRAFDTTGKTPGTYTIRVRVTDNGAVNGSDPARASKIATSTFTINSPPAPDDQTVDVQADDPQPEAITLTASDANGDPFTFDVPPAATTGSLSGSNASRSYTWPANFTGNDVFGFTATDDKNGTGNGTLTVRVHPNTTIDTATHTGATQDRAQSLTFSSPQSPIARYECRLLRNGDVVDGEDWATCSVGSTGSKGYSDLADGSYRFEVRAVNTAGQSDGTPASQTWRVDTTPPGTVFATGPNGPTNDPTPTWTLTIDDASPQETATYECRALFGPMNGTWVPCGSPSSPLGSAPIDLVDAGGGLFGITDPLTEGTYSFEARATDEVGLLGPATTRTFTVDLTPPGTNIASGPEGLINTRDVAFAATATEAGSTFRCELVGESQGTIFADGPCPGGASPAFSGLADDVYHLTITAVDPAGNLDPDPPVADFEVDATAPATSLDSGPPATTQSRKATIVFSGTDNRALAGFECRFDSSADEDWTPCESPETLAGLADGPHSAEVRAVDEAGNRDPSPVSVDWTVDRTAPTTTLDTRPDARSNTDSPQVTFHANEAGTFECSLDAPAAWQPCSSPLAVASIGGPLADGPHSLRIRSTDAAGNVEPTPRLLSWTVDTVAPEVTLDGVPVDPSPAGDAEIGFTVKDGSPAAPAPEVDTECAIDEDLAASPSTYTWQPCTNPLVIPSPSDGDHTVAVRARDGAGNVSPVATHAWTVLSTAPTAPTIDNAVPAAGSRTRLTNATIAFSHPNDAGLTYECRLDGAAWQECESPHAVTGLTDGDHTLSARVRDAVGNVSPAASHEWTVDGSAPGTAIDSGPDGLTRSQGAVFRFSSNKSPVTFECRLDSAAWDACDPTVELTGLADGVHTMRVRAVEDSEPAALKDPTPATRTWTVDATAPETTITSGPIGKVPVQTARFAFASDDPQARFQCKLDSEEYDACSNPIDLAGVTEGEHTFSVRAVDAAGNRDETPAEGTWVVSIPAPEPPATDAGPTGNFQATLASGSIRLGSIAPVDLAAGQASLDGSLAGDGTLTVPASGVQFKPLTLPVEVGTLKLNARIILSATGPASGKVPLAGGPASLSVPIQVKVEAELDNGTPLLGSTSQCFIAPLTFDLGGSYDAAAQRLSISAPAVTVPQAGDGCGALGAQVNALLGLPSDNNAVSLVFALGGAVPTTPNPGGGGTTTPTAKAALGSVKAALSKNTLAVPVKCTGAAAAKCKGAVQLSTSVKSGKKTKKVVLGKVSYSTTGGKTVTTKLKLSSSGLKLLTAAGKKGLRTTLELVPSGQTKASSTKILTLKSPAKPKKKGAKR